MYPTPTAIPVSPFGESPSHPDVDIEVAENGYILTVRSTVRLAEQLTLPQRRMSAQMTSRMADMDIDMEDLDDMMPEVPVTKTYVARDRQELLVLLAEHLPDTRSDQTGKAAAASPDAEGTTPFPGSSR